MRIIGYTYNAAVHCAICTRLDQAYGRITWGGISLASLCAAKFDENGVAESAIDREGNDVHPVFTTDEFPDGPEYCDDCCREVQP